MAADNIGHLHADASTFDLFQNRAREFSARTVTRMVYVP